MPTRCGPCCKMPVMFGQPRAMALGVLLLVLAPGGCQTPAHYRPDLRSPNLLQRVKAIVRAAEQGDRSAIDTLVALLDDPDAATRMYAIEALEKLCGTTMGYRYWDPEPQRRRAIARWQQARRTGQWPQRTPGEE